MRLIRYRIWDMFDNKFVDYIRDDKSHIFYPSIAPNGYLSWDRSTEYGGICYNDEHEEECKTRFVVQEFTGLGTYDDWNIKIYEGDIMSFTYQSFGKKSYFDDGALCTGVVVYEGCRDTFSIDPESTMGRSDIRISLRHATKEKIIGNVFQNKELMPFLG